MNPNRCPLLAVGSIGQCNTYPAGLIEPQGDPIQVRLRETLEICSPGNTVASSRWRSWLSLLLRHETRPCIPLHMRTSASGKIRGCCIDQLNRQHLADIGLCAAHVRF